jgi:ubiquinone/menaquinone biosynthesis C-methylase UbiE
MREPKNIADTDYFNEWSQTYEQSIGQFFFFDPVQRGILNLVAEIKGGQPPESILDVGCGTGRLLRKAGTRWPSARRTGVDLAEGMIGVARRLTPGADFLVGAAETLPLADASMDVILSTISFHHWSDQATGVSNVARMLRPGGIFCLADIVLPGAVVRAYRAVDPGGLSKFYQHFRESSPATQRDFLLNAGLRIVTQRRMRAGFVLVTVGMKG